MTDILPIESSVICPRWQSRQPIDRCRACFFCVRCDGGEFIECSFIDKTIEKKGLLSEKENTANS